MFTPPVMNPQNPHGTGPVMPPSNSLQPLHPGMGPMGPLPPFHKYDPRLQPLGPAIPPHGSGPVMPHNYGCHFPAPAPFRVYCQPAQFHRVSGEEYENLSRAYGSSKPAPNKMY